MSNMKEKAQAAIYPVTHVFEEAWLIAHLTVNLIGEMGSRIMWLWMTIRFALYVLLLSPAFLRAAFIYTISDFIKKSIVYGPHRRNHLDLYLPISNAYKAQAEEIKRRNSKSTNPQSHQNNRIKNKNKYENTSNMNNCNNEKEDGIRMKNEKAPVVVFFSGGAWMIGYKAWGGFMGMLLAQLGVLFVAPDHRNFPQGTITDMMQDCSTAIKWTFENIENYGGDKNKIFIVSQSAGAHISCLVLLKHAYYHAKKRYLNSISHLTPDFTPSPNSNINKISNFKKNKNKNNKLVTNKWDPSNLKAYIGIAGPYNLVELTDYWNAKGLYTNVLLHIMNGDFKKFSPIYQLYHHFRTTKNNGDNINNNNNNNNNSGGGSCSNLNRKNQILKGSFDNSKYSLEICPMYLFHGSSDETVPVDGTKSFFSALKEFDVDVDLKVYPNKSHTGPIVEDPIEGNDILVRDVLKIIYPNRNLDNIVEEIEAIMRGNLQIPKYIVDLARVVCPF